ncbi:hypothetical protein SLA2020_445200 [Shorea laevis]
MCFDYHGSWENFTGVHSALRDANSNFSHTLWNRVVDPSRCAARKGCHGAAVVWADMEAPGAVRYGIGAPALGVGPGGGLMDYQQILDFNDENNATVVFDGQTVSYYSYAGDSWIGYDDVQSVRLKIQFARSRQLGGYFFWALGKDKDWTISSLGML